jgi:hypothetical protein
MVGRTKPNQGSALSPFLSQLSEAKHFTATVTCCLQSSGWVATTYILDLGGNCRSFFIDLAWLISQRPIEYNYNVGLTPIELN